MTLRFTPRARNDLREIMDYIAKENPSAADRVGRAIFDTTALIAERPVPIWEFVTLEPRNCAAAWSRAIRTGSTIPSRTLTSGLFTSGIRHGAPG